MKYFTRSITLLALLTFALASCSDEEEAPKTNYFTIDGTEYALSQGITFEYGGDATTGYNFDLIVASSSLDFSDINNGGITGTGDLLYFELWSTSTTGLETGSYSFSSTSKPNTYTDIWVSINYDAATEKGNPEYDSGTGTVTIKVNGDAYTIDFDITLVGGKKMTGNFTGKLTNYPG